MSQIANRRVLLNLSTRATPSLKRPFSVLARRMAEGDIGAVRSGGSAYSDSFNRREKAAEDMYIREKEKMTIALLKERIALQEAQLAKDRASLGAMEDQYGRATGEERSG